MKKKDIKNIIELKIFRKNVFAGTLYRTKQGCEFILSSEFLGNPEFSEFSYRIPKKLEPISQVGVNLLPFFAGLLPEGLRFGALVKNLKTSEDDLFSILAAIGERCIGDIYAVADEHKRPEIEIPKVSDINFYDFLGSNLKYPGPPKGDESIAGVQEKISASMISFPVKISSANKSYILKLNPRDKPNLVQNEHQCLLLSRKCDIDVNYTRLVYDKDKNPGLLVERFDRVFDGSQVQMLHQEDACQFLNRFPADKYRVTMREIAEELQEITTAPLIENLKLLQYYALSYLIGNGDLHAKNISLQTEYKTGRIRLTPAYDIICTSIYGDQSMALKIDGRDKNIKRVYLLEFGRRLNIKADAIHGMLDKLLTKFKEHYGMLFEIEGLSKKNISAIKSLSNKRIRDLS